MEPLRYIHAELRALPDNVDETRTVDFVISDETRDRHRTVLKADRWKLDNYKRNPIVGYAHAIHGGMFSDPDPDKVIGKSDVFFEGKKMIGRVTFEPADINPLAEKIFQKVKFGSLRTASVGFIPTGDPEYGKGHEAKGQLNETAYFPGQELLEWSIVNIPSNPRAVKREIAEDTQEWIEKIAEALEGKHTVDELQKMTIKGITSLLTGEGVQEDKREVDESQQVDREKLEKELYRVRTQMSFHNDFDGEIEREKERQDKSRRDQLNIARLNIHRNKEV